MTALALQKTSSNSWLIAPANMSEMFRFCEMVAVSTFCPKDMRNRPGDVLCAVQYGAELGISAMQALQNVAVINGKPAIYGDLMLALVLAEPSVIDVEEWFVEGDNGTVAHCKVTRKRGDRERVTECTFSVNDAIRAKLWGKSGPWTDYPPRMLKFRARGFALRDACPDILKGVITREEAMDYPSVHATEHKAEPVSKPLTNVVDSPNAAELPADSSPIIKFKGHPKNGQHMSVLDARGCIAYVLALERVAASDPGAIKNPELPEHIQACKDFATAERGVQAFTKEEERRLRELQAAIAGESKAKPEVTEVPPDEDDLHMCVHPDAGEDSAAQKDIRNWSSSEHLLEYGTWLAESNLSDKEARIARVEARLKAVTDAEAAAAEAALSKQVQAEIDAAVAQT